MTFKLWEQAELISAALFNLKLTSGSGRGFDKGDSKGVGWICETKTFSSASYGINYKEFRQWRSNAAKLGKNFFCHLLPNNKEEILKQEGLVVLQDKLFKHLIEEYEIYHNSRLITVVNSEEAAISILKEFNNNEYVYSKRA